MRKMKLLNFLFLGIILTTLNSCYSGGRDNCIEGMMADGMTYEEAAEACDDFHANNINRE